MVHIVGHWTWSGAQGQTKAVKVYSNSDEVELFLNGKSLGAKSKGEYAGLKHPPRVWQVRYEPGTLRAVAHQKERELAHEVKTAGPAHHILLESDVQRFRAGDREELAYITATVVDEQGTPVPSSHQLLPLLLMVRVSCLNRLGWAMGRA